MYGIVQNYGCSNRIVRNDCPLVMIVSMVVKAKGMKQSWCCSPSCSYGTICSVYTLRLHTSHFDKSTRMMNSFKVWCYAPSTYMICHNYYSLSKHCQPTKVFWVANKELHMVFLHVAVHSLEKAEPGCMKVGWLITHSYQLWNFVRAKVITCWLGNPCKNIESRVFGHPNLSCRDWGSNSGPSVNTRHWVRHVRLTWYHYTIPTCYLHILNSIAI